MTSLIDAARLVASMPLLLASGPLKSKALFNLGATVAGSSMRK